MKKLALTLTILLAAASMSMAAIVPVDLTLVPNTDTINFIKTTLTLNGLSAEATTTASTLVGEFSKINLDVSINPFDYTTANISQIEFILQPNVGPINFDNNMAFEYDFSGGGAEGYTLYVDTVDVGGCFETTAVPMSAVTAGSFLGTEQTLHLDKGYFQMSGYTMPPEGYQANLYTDPAFRPMLESGMVTATIDSISGNDLTYDVEVVLPMEFIHPIPDPADPNNQIGTMVSIGTFKWTGAFATTLPIPGDADLNGVVNDLDAADLADNWLAGPDATWAMGDFTGDGYVNDADATLLAANWVGAGSAPASVPEPASLATLLAVALAGLALWRRR